jgi:hypothetical protein
MTLIKEFEKRTDLFHNMGSIPIKYEDFIRLQQIIIASL